jgi:hypothetical protein
MVDPVSTEDGLCYDRKSIEEWFNCCDIEDREYSSPATNNPLKSRKLTDNIGLRNILERTVNYLSKLEQKGELAEDEKALLLSYRQRAKELVIEKQNRYRNLNIYCRAEHRMQYKEQNVISPIFVEYSYLKVPLSFNVINVLKELFKAMKNLIFIVFHVISIDFLLVLL